MQMSLKIIFQDIDLDMNFRLINKLSFFFPSQIKQNAVRMTRRDPCLLQLKHGALLVLTIILAITAGMLIKIYG